MCARYTAIKDLTALIAQVLCLNKVPAFGPRYNIAPRQLAPVVVQESAQREMRLMQWGLIPAWAKDIGQPLINARAESLPEKPSFRQAFKARRCLIPADGFYEWKATPAGKMPHRFTLREEQWFCFAGLWESWQPTPAAQRDLFANAQAGVPPIETYTIITTAANELVRPLHDRMPVILAPINYDRWLNPRTPPGELAWLLRPFPADQMACARASRRVNSPRVEGPECLSAE